MNGYQYLIQRNRLMCVLEDDLKALTDAEQDSKELKSAKRSLLFERIVETVQLPFVTGEDGEKDALTKSYPASNWDAARNYAIDPPDRRAADGVHRRIAGLDQVVAHHHLDLGPEALGDLAGDGLDLPRAHVGGRGIDHVAGQGAGVGDRVQFTLDRVNSVYTITRIDAQK